MKSGTRKSVLLAPKPITRPLVVWTLGVYFLLVMALAVGLFSLSYVLGQRHEDPHKGTPYEAGIERTGSARVRFPASFYLVAMLFVVFDLESAFIFAWAVAAREAGWAGYVEFAAFIGVLLVTLVYLGRVGALDVASPAEKSAARKQRNEVDKRKAKAA